MHRRRRRTLRIVGVMYLQLGALVVFACRRDLSDIGLVAFGAALLSPIAIAMAWTSTAERVSPMPTPASRRHLLSRAFILAHFLGAAAFLLLREETALFYPMVGLIGAACFVLVSILSVVASSMDNRCWRLLATGGMILVALNFTSAPDWLAKRSFVLVRWCSLSRVISKIEADESLRGDGVRELRLLEASDDRIVFRIERDPWFIWAGDSGEHLVHVRDDDEAPRDFMVVEHLFGPWYWCRR